MGNKNELTQILIVIKAVKNVSQIFCSRVLKKAALESFFLLLTFLILFLFLFFLVMEISKTWAGCSAGVCILMNMRGIAAVAAVAHYRCWKYPLLYLQKVGKRNEKLHRRRGIDCYFIEGNVGRENSVLERFLEKAKRKQEKHSPPQFLLLLDRS